MAKSTRRATKGAARIHPTALVDPEADVAEDVEIGAYSLVGPKVRIGPGTRIAHHVTVTGRTTLGRRNRIHAYSCVGGEPQDLKYHGEDSELILGDENVIREGVTVNIGTEYGGGRTVIGSRCMLMASSHVAHDCILGDHVILSNCALLGGHVVIGDYAILSGLVAVHHFVSIGRHAFVSGGTGVVQDVPPFMIVQGERAQVKCVNLVGLKRRGLAPDAIEALKDAHKLIWRGKAIPTRALDDATRRYGDFPEVRELVAFLRAMARGRNGRALEAFRRDAAPPEDTGAGP